MVAAGVDDILMVEVEVGMEAAVGHQVVVGAVVAVVEGTAPITRLFQT